MNKGEAQREEDGRELERLCVGAMASVSCSVMSCGLMIGGCVVIFFFFSSRRRHTRCYRDWSSDVCSSDLMIPPRCYRDWSSDVCSSDLAAGKRELQSAPHAETVDHGGGRK